MRESFIPDAYPRSVRQRETEPDVRAGARREGQKVRVAVIEDVELELTLDVRRDEVRQLRAERLRPQRRQLPIVRDVLRRHRVAVLVEARRALRVEPVAQAEFEALR